MPKANWMTFQKLSKLKKQQQITERFSILVNQVFVLATQKSIFAGTLFFFRRGFIRDQ